MLPYTINAAILVVTLVILIVKKGQWIACIITTGYLVSNATRAVFLSDWWSPTNRNASVRRIDRLRRCDCNSAFVPSRSTT